MYEAETIIIFNENLKFNLKANRTIKIQNIFKSEYNFHIKD